MSNDVVVSVDEMRLFKTYKKDCERKGEKLEDTKRGFKN